MKAALCTLALLVAGTVARADEPPKAAKPLNLDAKPQVYDEKADAKAQIKTALAAAKRENRRVLIQWGGNWCSWCLLLHERFKSDKDLARTLRYEYDVVHVDSKNADLIAGYGADVKTHGFPYLTVLDADGKVLVNQSTVPFETKTDGKNGHDAKKLREFLTTHQAPARKADEVLAAALAEAKKTDRKAFVHFGAPWCGWCLRLDAWLARTDIAEVLGKDYVDVKIDTDRMTGGKDVLKKYNPSAEGGIPWFVILDADGKAVSTSVGPKGNVGFPADDHEVAHFVKVLEATKRRLTAADIGMLEKSLTPVPKK
jgi:thioredoxin-related protein